MSTQTQLASLAVEYWKLLRSFDKVAARVGQDTAHRAASQSRYAETQLVDILAEAGLSVCVYDGQQFSANLPVSLVNADDLADADAIVIESTLEPAIVQGTTVLRMGRVFGKGG